LEWQLLTEGTLDMATLLSSRSGTGRSSQTRTHDVDSAGLGELLRRARERRGLTLEQISKDTKIPRRHLEALERDNLAAVPGGFYQRAEIRTYARAVNLDQRLALAQLERALEPPLPREAVREKPLPQRPTLAPEHLLIVLSAVAAVILIGSVMGSREPARGADARVLSAPVSPGQALSPARETLPDLVIGTSQRTPSDKVAPLLAPSERVPAAAAEPSGARASSASSVVGGLTTEQPDARASSASITELVVTTQPEGARVTVNGIGWGTAPVTLRYLPPGDKRIRVSKEGYTTEERVVRLIDGHLKTIDIELHSAR
jgi:transcriptional regulator with XRE-family HTH domain